MDRRYQVFVSSTFLDLQNERAAVVSTLLEMDSFPAGMELFPATDEDAWTLIQRIIEESDYYLLVIGGKYGSVDPSTDLSWTEKEYDLAVSLKKPVMAFLHQDPGKILLEKSEKNEDARAKLDAFREKVSKDKHVKFWLSAEDLAGKVARSYVSLRQRFPQVGWVRGDVQTSSESLEELNDLRKRLAAAEVQVEATRSGPPPGTEDLAQGTQTLRVPVRMEAEFRTTKSPYRRRTYTDVDLNASWDDVFGSLGPILFDEADQATMQEKLNTWARSQAWDEAKETFDKAVFADSELRSWSFEDGEVYDDDFDTVLVQLRALGLIQRSERKRSVKDTGAYWTLTPYGDSHLVRLRAVRRDGTPSESGVV